MCTFFLRFGVIAVLLAGCHRAPATTSLAQPAPRVDTLDITLPVLRITPQDNADVSRIDSTTLALVERSVMSRLVSLMRAQTEYSNGRKTAGITPAKNAAPAIRQGLLGTITFTEDGAFDASSRERIVAIARLLKELDGPIEICATTSTGSGNIDIAIARARRVYHELIAVDERLAARDVAIAVNASNTTAPVQAAVEIFWRGVQ